MTIWQIVKHLFYHIEFENLQEKKKKNVFMSYSLNGRFQLIIKFILDLYNIIGIHFQYLNFLFALTYTLCFYILT